MNAAAAAATLHILHPIHTLLLHTIPNGFISCIMRVASRDRNIEGGIFRARALVCFCVRVCAGAVSFVCFVVAVERTNEKPAFGARSNALSPVACRRIAAVAVACSTIKCDAICFCARAQQYGWHRRQRNLCVDRTATEHAHPQTPTSIDIAREAINSCTAQTREIGCRKDKKKHTLQVSFVHPHTHASTSKHLRNRYVRLTAITLRQRHRDTTSRASTCCTIEYRCDSLRRTGSIFIRLVDRYMEAPMRRTFKSLTSGPSTPFLPSYSVRPQLHRYERLTTACF